MSQERQDGRLIPWDSFNAAFVEPGIPVEVPVQGQPPVSIYTDAAGGRIGMRAHTSPEGVGELQTPRAVEIRAAPGQLDITTADTEMFAPFYAFMLDVANRLQMQGATGRDALAGALAAWRRMLAAPSLMSEDARLGLSGELWVLERLIRASGPGSLDAWTGPEREAHDLRLAETEIEIKTTIGRSRTHIIGGAHQLVASPGMDLHLLSIQMERAGLGVGWSLPEQIAAVRGLLEDDPDRTGLFAGQLRAVGWLEEDAPHYPQRLRLRSEPRIVLVDDRFPRITEAWLSEALGERAARIDDVQYRIDVADLGHAYLSPGFSAVLSLAEAEEL